MSLRTFFLSVFSAYSTNGEVEAAEKAGREHARLIGGAYLRGFEQEFDAMLYGSRQKLLGVDDGIEDGEVVAVTTTEEPGSEEETAVASKAITRTRSRKGR